MTSLHCKPEDHTTPLMPSIHCKQVDAKAEDPFSVQYTIRKDVQMPLCDLTA
jgi:hypothetical protein